MDNKQILAKNLQTLMDKRGIDRTKLALDLNIKYSTVSSWLQGDKFPRVDKIELIANYFNINSSQLLTNTPDKFDVEDYFSSISNFVNNNEPKIEIHPFPNNFIFNISRSKIQIENTTYTYISSYSVDVSFLVTYYGEKEVHTKLFEATLQCNDLDYPTDTESLSHFYVQDEPTPRIMVDAHSFDMHLHDYDLLHFLMRYKENDNFQNIGFLKLFEDAFESTLISDEIDVYRNYISDIYVNEKKLNVKRIHEK